MATSLSKGLEVLACVADSPEPLSVRDLAERTGIPKSSVHRVVAELRAAGLLEAATSGVRLGMALFELGGTALQQNRLEAQARPFLEALFDRTGQLSQLGVLQGTDLLYLARVGRGGHHRVASPVGGRIPATCTASGKALLAFNPATLELAISEGLAHRTRRSITDPEVIRAELAVTRATGIAFDYEEARMGLACAASPIVVGGRARAALSVTMPVDAFDAALIGPAVRRSAMSLSRALASS